MNDSPAAVTSFYAFEQRFGVSRLFKMYVTPAGLSGAWIADRDFDHAKQAMPAPVVMGALGGIGGLLGAATVKNVVKGVEGRARQIEATCDALTPGSAEFLSQHKQNFSLAASDISGFWLRPNPQKARPNCYALLDIALVQGAKRSVFLVSGGTLTSVRAWLELLAPVSDLKL